MKNKKTWQTRENSEMFAVVCFEHVNHLDVGCNGHGTYT